MLVAEKTTRLGLPVLRPQDVTSTQKCVGCGLCAYMAPQDFKMVDTADHVRRPVPISFHTGSIPGLAQACPGVAPRTSATQYVAADARADSPKRGAVLEVWQGHAADPELQRRSPISQIITAISLYALERAEMHGVLHSQARKDAPFLNQTAYSTTRNQLLEREPVDYAPSSPCEGLGHLERAPRPGVFVGKASDVSWAARAADLNPSLKARLELTIATLRTSKANAACAVVEDGRFIKKLLPSIADASGQDNAQPWQAQVHANDNTQAADLTVVELAPQDSQPARAIVIVKTARAQAFLRGAIEWGYVAMEPQSTAILKVATENTDHSLMHSGRSHWLRDKAASLYRAVRNILSQRQAPPHHPEYLWHAAPPESHHSHNN